MITFFTDLAHGNKSFHIFYIILFTVKMMNEKGNMFFYLFRMSQLGGSGQRQQVLLNICVEFYFRTMYDGCSSLLFWLKTNFIVKTISFDHRPNH